MRRPTRATTAGQAYLDLQNRARAEGRATQELLTLYVVERWLDRLSMSPYADQFIIKGGMLLAAYEARRLTADLASGFRLKLDTLMICNEKVPLAWEDRACLGSCPLPAEGTFQMQNSARSTRVAVSADGRGLVSQAGPSCSGKRSG